MTRNNRFKIIIIVAVLALLLVAYYGFFKTDDKTVTIRDYVFQVEIADSDDELREGLSGRQDIGDNQAMLFIFKQKNQQVFWMKGMNFNIDLLWISADIVVGYEKNMLVPDPNTADKDLIKYYSDKPVDKVLEMKAGLIDQIGIEVGDRIIIN